MLYTVADRGWFPGSALPSSPGRAGLFRARSDAEAAAPGCLLLAVAVRYDAARGVVTSASPAIGRPGDWSAPAIVGPSGRVAALAPIPPALVRLVGEPRLRINQGHRLPGHPAGRSLPSRPHDPRTPRSVSPGDL